MGMWGRHLAAAGLLAITVTGCGDIGDLPSVEPQAPAAATATVRQSDTSSARRTAIAGALPRSAGSHQDTGHEPEDSAGEPAAPHVSARTRLHVESPHSVARAHRPAGHRSLRLVRHADTPAQHSGSTCHLRGWPGLTFFGDGVIQGCSQGDPSPRCGKPLSTSGPRAFSVTRASAHDLPDILLAPARTTFFTIVWQGSYAGGCVRFVDPAYGVEIRVPGDSRPLTLTSDIQISPCEGELQVGPFGVVS